MTMQNSRFYTFPAQSRFYTNVGNINNTFVPIEDLRANAQAKGNIIETPQDNTGLDSSAALNEYFKAQAQGNNKPVQNPLERQVSLNPIDNFVGNIQEIGTGLAYAGTHLPELARETKNYIVNRYGEDFKKDPIGTLLAGSPAGYFTNKTSRNVNKKVREDIFNFLMTNYDVNSQDLKDIASGKQTLGQVVGRAAVNAYKNPVDTTLDLLSFGVGSKALRGLSRGSKATQASQKAIDVATKEVKGQIQKFVDEAEEFKKVGTTSDRIGAIKALQTGEEVTGTTKQATKVLSRMVDKWDKATPERARINNFELAHNQRMVDTGKANSILEADETLNQFRKAGVPEELSLTEGMKQLENGVKPASQIDMNAVRVAAKEGNEVAQDILKSKELFDKGYLKLVPHGLAEVTKDAASEALARGKEHRFFQGKYSERVYGNASYEDIAKQLENPELWVDAQVKAFVEDTIADEILKKGTLGDLPLTSEGSKAIQYIDRATLETGDVTKALGEVKDVASKADDIAIDKSLVGELKKQLDTSNGIRPFGNSLANDIYSVSKRNILASGGYLAGNFYTGIANAFMNAGLNPVGMAQDFIESVATKNKLAKNAGIYRNLKRSKSNITTAGLKQIDQINAPLSNVLNAADAKIQNTIAEMALNRNLRGKGIELSKRADYIDDMNKAELGEAIHDARMVSLSNPSRTILPKALQGSAGILNPFWRWMDTAAQASLYMLEKHPVISNVVYNKISHDISFDKEAQNRMNLRVQSDKPFVTYKFNDKTGKIQELSSEFLPAMNTMRLIGNTARAIKKRDLDDMPIALDPANTVFWGSLLGSIKGVDRYGKPIMRPEIDRPDQHAYIFNNERYRFNSQTGRWEKIGAFQGDEILSTAIGELIAYPKLWNRTIAPAIAGFRNSVLGQDVRYYQPYQTQVLGEFAPAGQMPEYANPRRSMAADESLNQLLGIYTREYNPQYEERKDELNANSLRQMIRGGARRYGRTQEILNRYR